MARQTAIKAIGRMHDRLTAQEYTNLLHDTDLKLADKEFVVRDLKNVREKLGGVRGFWPTYTEVSFGLTGCIVIVRGQLQFERGWATEVSKWQIVGDHASLTDYRIDGPNQNRKDKATP
jgi:hypothetical protein